MVDVVVVDVVVEVVKETKSHAETTQKERARLETGAIFLMTQPIKVVVG